MHLVHNTATLQYERELLACRCHLMHPELSLYCYCSLWFFAAQDFIMYADVYAFAGFISTYGLVGNQSL